MTSPDRHSAAGEQLLRAHSELRRELRRIRAGLGPAELGRDLLTHCLTFCDNLGTHHSREDGAFTRFETEFPQLVPALERLRQEHRVVAETLAELRDLLSRGDAPGVRTELDQLAARLEDHFDYEEEQLLPALYR